MIRDNLDLQQAIGIIDSKIHPRHLNRVQEIILVKSIEGQTYSQIAIEHNYGMEYIKTSGSKLWKLLSQAFGQQINKSNCSSFIRKQILEFTSNRLSYIKPTENSLVDQEVDDVNIVKQEIDSIHLIAPKTSNFQGRESELATIKSWSNNSNCCFIMLTGMIGCGKTTLAIKAAQMLRDKFHRVIYLSMNNSRDLNTLIEFCLHSINPNIKISSDINKLLLDLTLYLKKYRCLIVIDDLDSVFEFKQMASYYCSGREQYAQLLRCLITTNHRSLIIANSRNNIKQLNYYSSDRVKSIFLKGMNSKTLWLIFKQEITKNISIEAWQQICNYYLNNPELMKIVVENLEYMPKLGNNTYTQYLPQFKEMDVIIENELKLLDEVGREIVYWLSLNLENHTLTTLSNRIGFQQYQRSKILKAIDFLKKRFMIAEDNCNYFLKPMYADYVQRYLIESAMKGK